jgi:hypothetical protein
MIDINEENGQLTREMPNGTTPAVIVIDDVEYDLYLPTEENINQGGDDRVFFHPLSQSSVKSDSYVIEWYRGQVNRRLLTAINSVFLHIAQLASDKKALNKLNVEQQQGLTGLQQFSKTAVSKLRTLIRASVRSSSVKDRLISIYSKRGAKLGGTSYSRASIVSFPLLEMLEDDSVVKPLGVDIKPREREAIISLYKLVFPQGDDSFSQGSMSNTAKSFHAYLKAVRQIADKLNGFILMYGIPTYEESPNEVIALDWVEYLEVFSEIAQELPVLPCNKGGKDDGPRNTAVAGTPNTVKSFQTQEPVKTQDTQAPPWGSNTPSTDWGSPGQPLMMNNEPKPEVEKAGLGDASTKYGSGGSCGLSGNGLPKPRIPTPPQQQQPVGWNQPPQQQQQNTGLWGPPGNQQQPSNMTMWGTPVNNAPSGTIQDRMARQGFRANTNVDNSGNNGGMPSWARQRNNPSSNW